MMKKLVTIITILLLVIPTYAESYVEAMYTDYATTASDPISSLQQLATTTMDDSPAYAGGRITPTDWSEPGEDSPTTPLGSPWPLFLFAVAYATYGAVRLRRRKLSANE